MLLEKEIELPPPLYIPQSLFMEVDGVHPKQELFVLLWCETGANKYLNLRIVRLIQESNMYFCMELKN